MFVAEGAEAFDVLVADGVPGVGELAEGPLGVDGVVERDAVDDQPERGQLLFLAVVVVLAQLAAVAMEHLARERVTALAAIELGEDPPAQHFVVALVQQVDRLGGASDLRDRAGQRSQVTRMAT